MPDDTSNSHSHPTLETFSDQELLQLGRLNQETLRERYLALFDFKDQNLLTALRSFLSHCPLQGETQEQDRVLDAFARRYTACNPRRFSSPTFVHQLVYAMILLNTDLANAQLKDKMTLLQFVENTLPVLNENAIDAPLQNQSEFVDNEAEELHNSKERSTAGDEETRQLLKHLYEEIRQNPITRRSISMSVVQERNPIPEQSPNSSLKRRWTLWRQTKAKPQDFNVEITKPFRSGILFRKHVLSNFVTRAPNRQWKPFVAALCGSDLLLFKLPRETMPIGELVKTSPDSFHSLRHAVASVLPAPVYSAKRPFVFQLVLPNEELYLFEVRDAKAAQEWVHILGWWSACESREPLPMGVGGGFYGFEKQWLLSLVPGGIEEFEREETKITSTPNQVEAERPPAHRRLKDVDEKRLLNWARPRYPFVPISLYPKIQEESIYGASIAAHQNPLGCDKNRLPTLEIQIRSWKERHRLLVAEMEQHMSAWEILHYMGIGKGVQSLMIPNKTQLMFQTSNNESIEANGKARLKAVESRSTSVSVNENGTTGLKRAESKLSRRSFYFHGNNSSLSLNLPQTTNDEQDHEFSTSYYWKPAVAIYVAGAHVLQCRDSEDDALQGSSGPTLNLKLPAPSHLTLPIPSIPICIYSALSSNNQTSDLPNISKENKTLANKIEQNWLRKYRYLQWELCKTQLYIASLCRNPSTLPGNPDIDHSDATEEQISLGTSDHMELFSQFSWCEMDIS